MKAINHILVVIDPTVERDFVMDRAKLIARATGASLTLYINNENTLTEHSFVYEGVDGDFFETQRKLFAEHYGKLLDGLVTECDNDGIKASSRFTEEHHLAEAIIAEVESLKPDLVLKSTHHHNALQRSLVSNTDWRLIRKCPAPLLLVKPHTWHSRGAIVTAVDPLHAKAEQSRLDHVLLGGMQQVADALNLQARVFHSYFPFVSTLFPMGGESQEHLDRLRDFHFMKVKALVRKYDIADSDIRLSEGELVPSLIKYLNEIDANMLVIGALSRNVLERAIIGNTAEKILEDCPCDVLVLKS